MIKIRKWTFPMMASILIIAYLTHWWRKTENRSECYKKIEVGQGIETVLECFGKPDKVHTATQNDGYFFQNAQRNDSSITKVILYPFFFDINIAAIYFGQNDRVVGKYLYSSP